MKYELFDFQKDAVKKVLDSITSMQTLYNTNKSLSAVSLTAPTGAGKTVIAAAVAEGLFYGNDWFAGDSNASILWLSDSPSLNEQTIKRFEAATDLIGRATHMTAITNNFAKVYKKFEVNHIYFLNRQLLSSKGKLTNVSEGGRTFYDVLNETISDDNIHLYLFIDEAHRGLGKDGTSDSVNKTIYSKLIDGQPGLNLPMPAVIGISATPERFNYAMSGRTNRVMMPIINVPVTEVRESGLIKDSIELRTPKQTADTKHQDLTLACKKLAESSKKWKDYCLIKDIKVVSPLMVVQVEDKINNDTLSSLCAQILKTLPWLDRKECFANVFGEQKDIETASVKIPYILPENVSASTEVKVLFAKDAISTGWDCPRAEVIYSRRKRTDGTYIAQLIGRMIRTPLARRISDVEELNIVSCYLPEFDEQTVETVVEGLKNDNVAVEAKNIHSNPVNVSWYGNTKKKAETKLEEIKNIDEEKKDTQTKTNVLHESNSTTKQENGIMGIGDEVNEFAVVIDDIIEIPLIDKPAYSISAEERKEITEVLERVPKVDDEIVKEAFEGIITRSVIHDKPNVLLDLWMCIDIVTSDLNTESDIDKKTLDDFYNNIEASIKRHPAEFKRTFGDIKNTTMIVKRIDPLTGEEFASKEELSVNDAQRLDAYYREAVRRFAGASDYVKFYINNYMKEELASQLDAIGRISAVSQCLEIMADMEAWAEKKIGGILDDYGSFRTAVSDENKDTWDRIEGNAKHYVERNLNSSASITRLNKDNPKYEKHIISDENGWAYFELNELEERIVHSELSKPLNVAWYRNQPRNLNASLSIAYKLGDKWENMYPDFIFFQKQSDGTIKPSIVDPHGDWLGDSVAKLKGYVAYLKDHPDTFGRVLAVTDEVNGTCRSLDLMDKKVQNAIDTFSGNSAKSLFRNDNLSRTYNIK